MGPCPHRGLGRRINRSHRHLSYCVSAMDPTRPEWQIGPPRPRPRTLWGDLAGLWRRFRGLPIFAQLVGVAVAILVVIALGSLLAGSGGGTNVASRSTTTRRPGLTVATTTTTLPVLPAGDDKAVKSVIDGDSFETADGVKIRLIGMDAPDVEVDACFSAEATSHLRDLLPAGRSIRVVYDASKTDRFGRTLAYVYRFPDGLFINVAQAKDGYAIVQSVPPNTAHDPEIAAAV